MLPQLSKKLLTRWSELPVDRGQPDRLSFLGVRTGVGDDYAMFLGFADGDSLPCLAVKIPRASAAQARLEHEWNTLNQLQRNGSPAIVTALPRPLSWERVGDVHVSVTTAPEGRPMAASSRLTHEHFSRVGEWLVQFACATRSNQTVEVRCCELNRVAERLVATFELSDPEMTVVGEWISHLEDMVQDGRLYLFASHGDLRRNNIWIDRDGLTIINWEHAESECLPLQDLFTFVTTYRFPVESRHPLDSYVRTFHNTYLINSPDASLVSRAITSYCEVLDIPPEGIEACFGVFLARAALQEYDRLCTAADRGYLPLLGGPNHMGRRPYKQAIRDQLWINLFRLLIEQRALFRLTFCSDVRRAMNPAMRSITLTRRRQAI
jgi:hypothetical protein